MISQIKVRTEHGSKRNNFNAYTAFDSCSNVTLITNKFAQKIGAKSISAELPLGAITGSKKLIPTRKYFLTVTDRENHVHKIEAFGLPMITSTFKEVILSEEDQNKLKNIQDFNPDEKLFKRERIDIDILMGMNYAGLHPEKVHSAGANLVVYRNCLKGYPWMLGGTIDGGSKQENVCCLVDTSNKFFSVEDFGVAAPKSCSQCKNCSDCNFLTTQISAKEKAEFDIINENLTHDPDKKQWICKYPLTENIEKINDTEK